MIRKEEEASAMVFFCEKLATLGAQNDV